MAKAGTDAATSGLALRVASAAIDQAAGKAVGVAACALLAASAPHPMIGVVGAALGGAARALVAALLDRCNIIEEQLDAVLAEPLRSAASTLEDVLSVPAQSPSELRELDRQLGVAFDRLRTAYEYASLRDRANCLTVRLFQSIVAALKEGGAPFAEQYVDDLRVLVCDSLERARVLHQEAQAIPLESREDVVDAVFDSPPDAFMQPAILAGALQEWEDRRARKEALAGAAADSANDAEALDRFCSLVERFRDNRRMLLRRGHSGTRQDSGTQDPVA
ncbi:MAG: hypothetical protein KAW67_07560 [Candidatus Eisenbacteria sp.]|nr:hypothetical protein [Candidatus Eisenbacteria bacterium]